jgi:hypothetical protein
MNIGPPRAGGVWLALVTVLGLGLMALAMPATAQGRPAVQPMPGAHANVQQMTGTHATVGLPNRDANPTNWPRRQPVLNAQPCSSNPYAYGYNFFSAPSFGNQPCAAPCPNNQMQGALDDPDMTSWYGYNRSEVAWWSSPNSNFNPTLGQCSGFQGWWTP